MADGHHYLSSKVVFNGFLVMLVAGMAILGMGVDKTTFFGALLVIILGILASEKVDKTVLVMLGSGLCLFLGIYADLLHIPFNDLPDDVKLTLAGPTHHYAKRLLADIPVYIGMIEWPTIGIIVGTGIFVELTSRSGIFTWSAIKVLKASKGNPFLLLVLYSVLTVVFSAFLNNVTAMIIVGSLTVVSASKLGFDPKPFLITEAILTNVGGLLTLISSIPNIIVAEQAGITFAWFFVIAAPYTIFATALTIGIARWLFRHDLKAPATEEEQKEVFKKIQEFDEWETVKDFKFFKIAAVGLVLVIGAFALKDQLPVLQDAGLEFIAMTAGTLMLILFPKDVEETLSKIEWSLVFFFLGLFTIIGVMEHAHVLEALGEGLQYALNKTGEAGSYILLWSSAILSSLTDNIPLSAVLAKAIKGLPEGVLTGDMWWSVIIGANLGGNITPIGSASTVVAFTIFRKERIPITFMEFVKIGGIFATAQLLLGTGYIFILNQLGIPLI